MALKQNWIVATIWTISKRWALLANTEWVETVSWTILDGSPSQMVSIRTCDHLSSIIYLNVHLHDANYSSLMKVSHWEAAVQIFHEKWTWSWWLWWWRWFVWILYFLNIPAIETGVGGPTAAELVHLVDQCDLTNSRATTPSVSPSPLLMASGGQSQYTPQALRRQLLSIHSESVVSIPENVELNDSLGLEKSESTSETDSLAKFKS